MADAGMQVPAIEERPTAYGLEWLWEAFMELSTCRPTGFSIGRIPWTAVQQYGTSLSFTADELFILHRVIAYLDSVLVKHHADKH